METLGGGGEACDQLCPLPLSGRNFNFDPFIIKKSAREAFFIIILEWNYFKKLDLLIPDVRGI